MPSNKHTVTIQVVGGPTMTIPFTSGMNAQQAMEKAFDSQPSPTGFTYALQYFGAQLGYLVVMINETYESFISSSHPFYFWEFLVNGQPAQSGIDNTVLNPDDVITFELRTFGPTVPVRSTMHAKYRARLQGQG
jgi:Domain of unknown function (DUF4430)